MTYSRLFQTERVRRRNFKFDKNGRKLSKRIENTVGKGEIAVNTVGKGEIARYEQFLLFPQFFQKACFRGASKGVNVWEWVKTCDCMVKGEPFCYLAYVCPITGQDQNTEDDSLILTAPNNQ